MNPQNNLTKNLAVFMILLLGLMPVAVADIDMSDDLSDEFIDSSHASDNCDNSENDLSDSGNFDFSAISSLIKGGDSGALAVNPLNSVSASSATAQQLSSALKPQAVNFLKYDESFSADLFSGSATYTYPIEVPPGISDLEPAVYLSYNHHASRSILGVVGSGWALNLNYVYRDTQNTRTDTADDVFVLHFNGLHEKLIFVHSENRYHTEHESYLFIQKVLGGDNDKKEYWVVKTKDGTEYRFGYQKGSELVSNLESYVVKWSLDQVKDVHGNTITYSYIENPNSDIGTDYLGTINYGINSVSFNYNHSLYASPDLYINGNHIKQSGVLTEVVIKHGDELVRKYLLKYQLIENRPFLSSITETGKDGMSTLPSTEFTYNGFESGFQESPAWQLPDTAYFGMTVDEGVRLVDINADSLIDVVKAKGPVHEVSYNNGSGFGAFQQIQNFISSGFVDAEGNDEGVRFLDINGDTKIDVAQSVSWLAEKKVLKSNSGAGWTDLSYNLPVGISFVKKIAVPCYPLYMEGYDCQDSTSCDETKCKRSCSKIVCSDSGTVVFTDSVYPKWNDNGYDEEETSDSFTPRPNKCYKFEYIGSKNTDGDDSECYDLYTDYMYYKGKKRYDKDCNGVDLDAYAGVGFVGNDNARSWLSTVDGGADYGFISGIDNSGWDNRYVSEYGKDGSPDDTGSNVGDWDGLNDVICDEAGPQTIYCTPSAGSCYNWYKDRCGYGCAGEGTAAFVAMGVYGDYYNDLRDALYDNSPSCHDEIIEDNDYYGYGEYTVTEYPSQTESKHSECVKQYRMEDQGVRLVDVDADGKTDIIQATDSVRRTWLNTEKGFVESNDWELPSDAYFTDTNGKDRGLRLGDVNGDGLVDLVKGENEIRKTWINTGKGWVYEPELAMPSEAAFVANNENSGTELSDVNLDGLSDLVKANGNSVGVWINTGHGWSFVPLSLPGGTNFIDLSHQIVDINGDGVVDIIKATSSERKTWLGKATMPYGLLATIKNGLGGRIVIDYEQISSFDNTGSDDLSDLSFGGYVVSSVTYDDGLGNKATHTHAYEGGLFDSAAKEFRGFNKVVVTSPDNTKSEHYFLQDSATRGLQYRSQTFNQSSSLFRQIDNNYSVEVKYGYYIVKLLDSKESIYDGYSTDTRVTETAFKYDLFGNPAEIHYFGDISQLDDDRYVNFTYADNTDSWIVNKPMKKSLFDSSGTKVQETYYVYDDKSYGDAPSRGLVTREELWLSTGNNTAYSYSYDFYGNLITETDPNGQKTHYRYDSTHTFVNTITNALEQETRFEYDEGTGSLKSETGPNGYVTYYEYDLFGRETKEVRPYDSSYYPTQQINYYFDGVAPEKIVTKKRTQSLTNNTYDTYTFYDGFGRLIQTKSAADNTQQITKYIRYDGNGRVSYESSPHFVDLNTEYEKADMSVPGSFYTYDILDRVVKITNPDKTAKKLMFDRGLIKVYDEKNHRKDYLTDGFGRITKVSEYVGDETYQTTYSYDATDNLLSITNNENNTIRYAYDSLGRKIALEDPDIGRWSYVYDPAGNLISQTDGNNHKITLTYDPLNRLTKKVSQSETIRYIYDAEKKGTLSKVELDIGTIRYNYDDRLRVAGVTETYDGITFSTKYEYDALDRLVKVTLPDDSVIDYVYNNQGLVTKIGDVITEVDYNAQGLPTQMVYANGVISEYSYDESNSRLAELKTGNQQNFLYEYNAVGSIEKIDDLTESAIYTMEYDDLDRLTKAELTGSQEISYIFSYEYDSLGNIVKVVRDDQLMYMYNYGTIPIHAPFTLQVIKINKAPEIVTLIPNESEISMNEGELLTFSVEAVDQNDDALEYTWELDGEEVSTQDTYAYAPSYQDAGRHTLKATVSDGELTDSKEINLEVFDVNRAPQIKSITPSSETITMTELGTQKFKIIATDPDEDELAYNWKLDETTVSQTTEYSYVPTYLDVGNHNLAVTVSDGKLKAFREIKIAVVSLSCSCPDLNQDGIVDVFDLARMGMNYGKDVSSCPECDLNNDGKISNLDITCLSKYMNTKNSDILSCQKQQHN